MKKMGMAKSGVPWADYRWNPVEGCCVVSEGCVNCYAARLAHRFGRQWGAPVFHEDRLCQPMNTKKGGRVFVCSTSDFGHYGVPFFNKVQMCEVMRLSPQHTFLVLTKRPTGLRRYQFPVNVWLGVTGENQYWFERRWPVLCEIPGRKRFVSVEPMLGPVKLIMGMPLPDWVIAGPETGPGKRECRDEWIDGLMDQCLELGIPFFDKRPGGKVRDVPSVAGVE